VVVNDIAADQLADHGASQNIGWEMIQTSDTRKANCCGESVRADNNEGLPEFNWYIADR
jgi:hypothetical protein